MPVYPASHKMAHNEPSTLSTRHSGKMLRELVRLGILSLSFQAIMLCVLDGRISWHVLQYWKRSQKLEKGKELQGMNTSSLLLAGKVSYRTFGGFASFWDSFKWKKGFASLSFYDRYIIISVQIMCGYCLCAIIHVHYWVDFVKYVTPLRIWY